MSLQQVAPRVTGPAPVGTIQSSRPRHTGRLWVLLVACNLIWASQFVMVKLVQEQLGPVMTTFLPMLLATVLLAPITVLYGRRRSPTRHFRLGDVGAFCMLGILGQVAAQLGVTWGLSYAPASNAAVFMLALPVFTALMGYVLLREHMTRRRWISFVLAIIGAIACSHIEWRGVALGGSKALLGDALIVVSIAGSAFYNVYSKRMLERYSPLEVLLYSYMVVVLTLAPVAFVMEPLPLSAFAGFTSTTILGIGMLGVFQYLVSMLIFFAALQMLDAIQASLGNYLIPFFGLLIAAVVLGERLTWYVVAGGLLVLGSTVLGTAREPSDSAAQKFPGSA